MSEKEILDALNVLKSVCEENEGKCSECILRNGDVNVSCGVVANSNGEIYCSLKEWQLKDYENPRLILS